MDKLVIEAAKNQYLYANNQKYLDFCMSNGAMILGHSNKIFLKSINNQKNFGSNFSFTNIQNEKYKNEIKKMFIQYKGIHFCNSGSEANIRALRIIKTITSKKKFAMINGSWHGSVDNFMFGLSEKNKIFETGGSSYQQRDVIMLKYNDIKYSLNLLKKNKKKLAGLILEPIQASSPTEKSEKFIKAISKFCKKYNILIIFDEIITGLRVKNFTIFKKLKIEPDIITFGKIFGGGLPIGICCIKKNLNNKIEKLQKKIFFGGTFSGNPLVSEAGLNTFKFIKKNKKGINKHTEKISKYIEIKINNHCKRKNYNFRIQRYESILKPMFSNKLILNKIIKEKTDPKLTETDKLRKFLLKNLIFIPRSGTIFVSFIHNMANAKKLVKYIVKYLDVKCP